MANLNDIHEILKEIKTDWKDINTELRGLIKESTAALTRVDVHLDKPFWKRGGFYTQLIQISVLAFLALN